MFRRADGVETVCATRHFPGFGLCELFCPSPRSAVVAGAWRKPVLHGCKSRPSIRFRACESFRVFGFVGVSASVHCPPA